MPSRSDVPGPLDDRASVRRIAVLRGGGLGDLVVALPALEALRRQFPHAEIALLGAAWQAELVEGRPGVGGGPPLVDRAVALSPAVLAWLSGRGSQADADAAHAAAADIGRWRPDVGVQVHGGGRHSNPFVTWLGARMTVGLRAPGAPPLDHTVPYVYYQPEVFRGLEVVGLLGCRPVVIEPRLVVREAERAEAARVLQGVAGRALVVLHPGASDARRWWPAGGFAEVARCAGAVGAAVAVVGAAAEASLARTIVAAAGPRACVMDLTGRLDLAGLAGVLAAADVVVANDSGPLHLARALGTATVGIYWCGNLVNAGSVWRRRHRPAIAWRLDCPICGVDCTRGRCDHDASFVADVPADEVARSMVELLAIDDDRSSDRRDATVANGR